jgi:enamine deaminase RidA (YjgF/YER057c/UK114 family)
VTTSSPEARVRELGLRVPDYSDPPYGGRYGTMKPFHRSGRLLMLSGMTPETRDGTMLHPGRLGRDVTVEQGYAAARLAAVNLLGLVRLALGTLDEVAFVVSTLDFVVTTEDFTDGHLVSEGAADLLIEVFGAEAARATRATIGAMSLSRGNCFEIWATVECRSAAPEEPR